MGYRRVPFAIDEYYHCYNRGVDKRTTFENDDQYRRFLQLLYLANDTKALQRPLFEHISHIDTFLLPRRAPLVAIGAYCLMPNHIHLLMREISDNGITRFMHKIGTGYALYYNNLHDRVGNLFLKPFRSKHIANDSYLVQAAHYIHMNPCELFERGWKSGEINNMHALENKLTTFPYSSLADYISITRPERAILDEDFMHLIRSFHQPVRSMLSEARAYYKEVLPMVDSLK